MKRARGFAALLSCLLLAAVVAAQTSEVEWVHGTDFSRFHTFTWAKPPYPIQDPDASLRMARVIQEELENKGVLLVDQRQKFDLFVAYNAIINPDVQDPSRRLITLKLRIFDSRNNTVIWRAGGYLALLNDKEQNRRQVRALLASMFQKYPPPD